MQDEPDTAYRSIHGIAKQDSDIAGESEIAKAVAKTFTPIPSKVSAGRVYFPEAEYQASGASAETLIRAVFGKNAPHYTSFVSALER